MEKPRKPLPRQSPYRWGDRSIEPGETVEVSMAVSESYSSLTIPIPVVIRRGRKPGPTVFVTAALHGDEINGTGAIRALIRDNLFELARGALILVPVVNILGFDRHSRYLPDRRDLNRCFPGSAKGSLASRMAHVIFREIVGRADYGIDFHTGALRRTNFPNVRADMDNPDVAQLAHAFGCEFILHGHGPEGALRREATAAGCPTIILEAGEVWKVESSVVEYAIQGVVAVLGALNMVDTAPRRPEYQEVIRKSKWVRASRGGFLRFHVSPGVLVRKGDPVATSTSLTGAEHSVITSPHEGVVIGMTTLPAVAPGEPICNIGLLHDRYDELMARRGAISPNDLHLRALESLSTNVRSVDRNGSMTQPKTAGESSSIVSSHPTAVDSIYEPDR
jgi:predicted deacylase